MALHLFSSLLPPHKPLLSSPRHHPLLLPHVSSSSSSHHTAGERALVLEQPPFELEPIPKTASFNEEPPKDRPFGVPRGRIEEPEFRMTLSELVNAAGIRRPVAVYGDPHVSVTGVQNDSRKVIPGDLFVCCVGCKTDGHLYITDAVRKGAVAVLSSKEVHLDLMPHCGALVVVQSTNSVLPVIAAAFYKNPSRKMSVVGITGTNGKTTTSHLARAIYEAMGLRTGMLGTVGYYINGNTQLEEAQNTTPDAVAVQKLMAKMVHNGAKAVVMEASSHGLALGRCDEVDFDVAVFTNLTRDHFDFHRTEQEYRKSKAKLFSKMVDPQRHVKIVNIDDPNAKFFIAQGNRGVPVLTFAVENKNADIYPLKFELSLTTTKVLIKTPNDVLQISSRLIGRHNVYNILAAAAVGIAVGASGEEIARGIEGVDGVSGRFESIDVGRQPFGVIVDFAHTPDALSKLLDTVRELGARRIITVVGCAGESDKGKRPIMTELAVDKSEVVILTSDNPKTENPLNILDDMLAGVGWTMHDYVHYCKNDYYPPLPNGHRLFVHDNRRVAVRAAIAMAEKGDIVVVAGRGHEDYQLQGHKKIHLDDREECREALHYINKLHRAGLGKRIPTVVIREPLLSFHEDVEARPVTPKRDESFSASPVH
ncbi:uncharacterized protein LOC109703730 [Ananas comosus]|uniref:UDP-N-acetylmuramoyl-L-alanyl-D-glutamate--2,6-diaminopimelate ligase MurE homolog, chloroplastic n=1 Tax=Ananas comosus TaxID=4615 RepID=A0A6P5EAG6_ANACO|nr:uncharacterized protein LOC109703730 [Ananas comosus]